MGENRKRPFCGGKMIYINTDDGAFVCTTCAEYANPDVIKFIENLQNENERLKGELKQMEVQDQVVVDTLRRENEKLKCLALHLFSKYFFDCYWNSEGPDSIRYLHLSQKYGEAYRKTKKVLREGK